LSLILLWRRSEERILRVVEGESSRSRRGRVEGEVGIRSHLLDGEARLFDNHRSLSQPYEEILSLVLHRTKELVRIGCLRLNRVLDVLNGRCKVEDGNFELDS